MRVKHARQLPQPVHLIWQLVWMCNFVFTTPPSAARKEAAHLGGFQKRGGKVGIFSRYDAGRCLAERDNHRDVLIDDRGPDSRFLPLGHRSRCNCSAKSGLELTCPCGNATKVVVNSDDSSFETRALLCGFEARSDA